MEIETKLSGVKINEVAAGCGSEVLAETDVIVPAEGADILRILQIDATAYIREKEVGSDRVILRGDTEFTIIYVPDPAVCDMPARSIKATASFTDVCSVRGVSADMKIHSTAAVSGIDYDLVNSRKINVKASVFTEIKAVRQGETMFISDAEADGNLEVLQSEVLTYGQEADDDFIITAADKIEVPAGKQSVFEILKINADVTERDAKLIGGKVIVKGTASVQTLYIGAKDMGIEYMEHDVPFTEILDLQGVTEDMECDMQCDVLGVYSEADEGDGGARIIGVEITMLANVNVTRSESARILSDCYSSDCEIALTRRVCTIDHIAAYAHPEILIRDSVELYADEPGIARIYSFTAKPRIKGIKTDGGSGVIDGELDTELLYLTNEPEIPVHSIKRTIPFSHTCDAQDALADAAECFVNPESVSYTLNGERSVSIRAVLEASVKFIRSEKVNIIEDIKPADSEMPPRAPIVVYFVQKGDTMWSVGKKYRVRADDIARANGIDGDKILQCGEKLLIP